MSVSNINNVAQYTGDGATVTFGLTAAGTAIPYFAAADWSINLFDTTALANVVPQPVLGGAGTYDYTIATVSTDAATGELTGNLVFNNAPLGNHRATATRNVAATSSNNFLDNSKFPAQQVNAQLDRVMMVAQRAINLTTTALTRAASDPVGAPVTLPPDALLRGNYLGFDSATPCNPVALAAPAGTTAVSAAMAPVLVAATLAAARTALGLGTFADTAQPNNFSVAQILKSVTAGAAAETFLTVLRNKGAGAANDFLEALAFDGMSSTSIQRSFARLVAQIVTATNGAEAGRLILRALVAGAETDIMTLGPGAQLGAPAGGDKGAGTLNATGLFIGGVAVSTSANTPRVLATWNGTTGALIGSSINVSSVTRNSVGNYTVNFTAALANANYPFFFGLLTAGTGASALIMTATAVAAGSLTLATTRQSGAVDTDPTEVTLLVTA